MTPDRHEHDVLIIGGGLTGLMAALTAARQGARVAVLSKVHPLRSHSVAAQGGVNAALGNNLEHGEDSWEAHAFDTVKGSDYLADQDAVAVLCRSAPQAVRDIERSGTLFSRDAQGRIAQRPFGGAGYPRTCYAADHTGHDLLHTLYEQCMDTDIEFYEDRFVTSLAVEGGRCLGAVALNVVSGETEGYAAAATLLATGGYGRIYEHSTNAHICTGDGAHLALNAGVPLRDMEFVQFHPTGLNGSSILISEAARGEGGVLLNANGERFMARYSKAMELAPRDIVARAMQTEIMEGRGKNDHLDLDLTHLGEKLIEERLPGIRRLAIDFAGVDPVQAPIPVRPAQHYSMGGIEVGNDCATLLPGLYAAGECSCVSVHGANRLGGNSLLETLVFGRLAGDLLGKARHAGGPLPRNALSHGEARLAALEGEERQAPLRAELKSVMWRNAGIFRDERTLAEGLSRLRQLQKRAQHLGVDDKGSRFNTAVVRALELQGMLRVAEAVAMAAMARRESRGSHFRTDFPKRDDKEYLSHSVISAKGAELQLSYAPVRLGMFPVKERVY
jgi:succinate dehydrogenase / fumarate reductase flavoprotein subunit